MSLAFVARVAQALSVAGMQLIQSITFSQDDDCENSETDTDKEEKERKESTKIRKVFREERCCVERGTGCECEVDARPHPLILIRFTITALSLGNQRDHSELASYKIIIKTSSDQYPSQAN
jgi:hypothetical protein